MLPKISLAIIVLPRFVFDLYLLPNLKKVGNHCSKESKKEVIYLRMTDFESWKGLSVCFENQRKLFKVSKKEII